ncbi:hypothetical protein [Gordonia soli]|uniref:Uncharacterized protein n=1 Tax=Gordonia soli NBRC 108243 TaxID=1223545 RepID=M0QCV2_9ACTN|nr:hypothetical protein [Gordonia soli]GAC66375.1 hypothetical protein GS4_02_00850 [Gordonia soli NBRC 108243]
MIRNRFTAILALTSATVGVAGIVGAGLATAAPTPVASTSHLTPRFFSGDPWPFSVQDVTVTRSGETATVRSGALCNAFVATTCLNYSAPVRVTVRNLSTGRTTSADLTDRQPTTVSSGRGTLLVTAAVTGYRGLPGLSVVG